MKCGYKHHKGSGREMGKCKKHRIIYRCGPFHHKICLRCEPFYTAKCMSCGGTRLGCCC